MMIGNMKEEGRVCIVLLHVVWKSPTPSQNRLTAILNWKKSNPGSEPGLPRQNAITLPLVPPPLPLLKLKDSFKHMYLSLWDRGAWKSYITFGQTKNWIQFQFERCSENARLKFWRLLTNDTGKKLRHDHKQVQQRVIHCQRLKWRWRKGSSGCWV